MKVQKEKNEQKMLALNILTNNLKEVKDEVQVAPKGGQCYTVERTANKRTARWYKLNSKKEVKTMTKKILYFRKATT